MEMNYRFKRDYRGKRVGDPVPTEWDWGTIDALIQRGIVETPALEAVGAKAIDEPPADKSLRRERVKRK